MINQIQLKNWKSHRESELQFGPGTNVLVGSMGSGKSSILQGISFAFFGTFAELKHRDLKAADIISRSAEQKIAEVTLSMTSPQNNVLQIKRKIDARKAVSEGTVRDAEGKLLAGPQATQVNDFIKKELGVDDEVFLRTVYAMQNETDMILKLAPKERKKRVDELMGLNKFEVARNNCVTLRNRTLRNKQDSEAFLESIGVAGLSNQIKDAETQIDDLKSKQLGIGSELSRSKTEKDSLRVIMLELRDKFQETTKLEERKRSLLRQLNELAEKLADRNITKTTAELENEIIIIKNKLIDIQKEKDALTKTIDEDRNKFMTYDKRAALSETQLNNTKTELKNISKLKQDLSGLDLANIGKELAELKKELDKRKGEKQANLAELKNVRDHLEKVTLAESACPVCDSQLTLESKEQLVSKHKKNISQILYQNTELSEFISKLENRLLELDELSNKNKNAIDILSKEDVLLKSYETCSIELKNNRELAQKLDEIIKQTSQRIVSIDKELELSNAKLNLLNNEKHLYEMKEKQLRLNEDVNVIEKELKNKPISKEDVDKKEEEFQRLLRQVQDLETTLKNSETLLIEKTKRLAELNAQKQKVSEIEQKIKEAEEKAGFLDRFKTALEATQLALRDELILAVNEVMSQVWVEIYPYEKWSGVRLASTEQDYTLQMKETDGDWVPVSGFASGGERMLASLAVRIAFSRVLAPGLSLLILDEPTHNLDEKAITTFIDVIQNKVSDFLDQIFIVTHEEKLAENADHVIRL
jgi:DNA repair protein SbcC/Rad50